MRARDIMPSPLNCFWLFLPVLALNAISASSLPAAMQPAVFRHDIPTLVAFVEDAGRIAAMVLAAWMPLRLRGTMRHAGWAIYLAGLAAYFAAWSALVAAPESGWSLSAAGFAAPAYLPAIWLAGIGLIGCGQWKAVDIAFAVSAASFCTAHTAHALLVWLRLT